MEEGGSTSDRNKIAQVLTEGMDRAKQLRRHLRSAQHPSEANDLHLQRIISSFEKALMFLNWGGGGGGGQPLPPPPPPTSLPVDSSRKTTANESPSSVTDGGYMMKKRKRIQPVWREQVKIKTENGLEEGPSEDSYSWRKYGQKDILGAKYPRSYYRCTYRLMRHCWATKQVQRSDDDPTFFEVTYKGTHSCNHVVANSAPEPESPQKVEEQVSYGNEMEQQTRVDAQKSKEFTFTSALGCQDGDYNNSPLPTLYEGSPMSAYSSLISSPATSRGDHYRDMNYQMMMMMKNYVNPLQHYETQVPDIVSSSNHTSTTDSPSGGGMEYSLNEVHPNFQFDFEGIFR